MQNTIRRFAALSGLFAFFAAAPAFAQVGPIQPVLVMIGGSPEVSHARPDLGDDYSIPLEVLVGADGIVTKAVVSDSSHNAQADATAVAYIRERRFLPGLDVKGEPVASTVKVTVNMYTRGGKKVVRVTLKPPLLANESQRIKKLMCADFMFELNRIMDDAKIRDTSLEVLPYVSAHMYMTQKNVPSEVQEKFWDQWPKTLDKIVDRCEKNQLQMFYAEVLVPALDGAMPSADTVTASSAQ
ncbi:MAG TPA: energy transducer TonB [Steroidobacteraceae bacterium]|nr:energy transducer TonB [Steroidobacteraceae bacterium]